MRFPTRKPASRRARRGSSGTCRRCSCCSCCCDPPSGWCAAPGGWYEGPCSACAWSLLLLALPAHASVYAVTVAGLVGEPDYEQRFTSGATDLDKVLKGAGADVHVFTLTGAAATRARLTQVLGQVAKDAKPEDDFVLILIGHGSFDGVEYKFNLVGPDISAAELADLCNRVPARRQLIVNTTSASGGSVAALQRAGRAVIASTKSGTEKNATVFARYWVAALQDPAADVDKSESTSALEAFQYADRKTAEFYTAQKRLATEHRRVRGHRQRRAGPRAVGRQRRGPAAGEPDPGSVRRHAEGGLRLHASATCSPRRKISNGRSTCSSTRKRR